MNAQSMRDNLLNRIYYDKNGYLSTLEDAKSKYGAR